MSEDKETIQKLQTLIEDSNISEGDYLKFSNLLQEVYNKKSKSPYDSDYDSDDSDYDFNDSDIEYTLYKSLKSKS